MNIKAVVILPVAVAAALAIAGGCVDGPVATHGVIGGVSEYGAILAYGETQRANTQCNAFLMSRDTTRSVFNAAAADTTERIMFVFPATNAVPPWVGDVLRTFAGTNTLNVAAGTGYSPAWTAPTKAASGVTLAGVEAELAELKAKAAATSNATTTATCNGTNCATCAGGACTPTK